MQHNNITVNKTRQIRILFQKPLLFGIRNTLDKNRLLFVGIRNIYVCGWVDSCLCVIYKIGILGILACRHTYSHKLCTKIDIHWRYQHIYVIRCSYYELICYSLKHPPAMISSATRFWLSSRRALVSSWTIPMESAFFEALFLHR